MAITNFLQKCEYKIGGLQPYIYLIHKNALTVRIKAKGIDVSFNNIPKANSDSTIFKVEGASCVYNQEETFNNKYRFNSTLELVFNEQYREPFFYGLETLRLNQYYIIIEDKKGIQYLVNPELFTKLSYEYTFGDAPNINNACIITWNNLCNYPLLIMKEKVEHTQLLFGNGCDYNVGQVLNLVMAHHNEIKTKDDGIKITELYFDNVEVLKDVEYLKESFSMTETYDGNRFKVDISYSIPLDDNQFNWHYDLLEFKKNKYIALVRTTNHNYYVIGTEKGLSPSYNITTGEDDETLNMVNISFSQISQYPILWTDMLTQLKWVEFDSRCVGFDKYSMLIQHYSEDWGETWIPNEDELKKKGELIEENCEDCVLEQWVEAEPECYEKEKTFIKYKKIDGHICENGNKYAKMQKLTSTDGETYVEQKEYVIGELLEANCIDCQYTAIKWVDVDDDYVCFPVDETLTKWDKIGTECSGTTLYEKVNESVTNNGVVYYETGNIDLGNILKENCCACGYYQTEYRFEENVCGNAVEGGFLKEDNTYPIEYSKWLIINVPIKGRGLYIIDPIIRLPEGKTYAYNNYIQLSRLDENVIQTTNTSTSSLPSTSYNQGVMYVSSYNFYKYGKWTYEITDNDEHNFQIGLYCSSSSYSGCTADIEIQRPLLDTSSYNKYYLWEYCSDEYDSFETKTEVYKYELAKLNDCSCGYREYEWRTSDPLELKCGEYETVTEWVTLTSDFDRSVPLRKFRIDATDPYNGGNYFIRFTITPDTDTTSNTWFSICPDEGTIWDNSKSKRITAQTKIEGSIYEYEFSRDVYFSNAETNAPLSQVQCYTQVQKENLTNQYYKEYLWEYCPDEEGYDARTDEYRWLLYEENSCACNYIGYEYQWNGETICGSELAPEPYFIITDTSGNWTVDGNTFTSNKISHSQRTVQRIYFKTNNGEIKFTINQDSESCCDYLIISKLNSGVTNSTSTGSTYPNYAHWSGKTNGTITMTVPNEEEYFIELMYRKDGSISNGRDNVIVTLEMGDYISPYDLQSEYEVWREYEKCTSVPTGNIEYRNPKKSYKCGWVTYQWREEEITCGGELPENTTEVNEAPELNTDFE